MEINGTKYEAADVLAGAYMGRGRRGAYANLENRTLLVHTVEVGDDGHPTRVLCGGVKLDHLITDADDTEREPTCPKCKAKLESLRKKASS